MTINERFRKFLFEEKITKSDFSNKVGINKQSVGDVENGKTKLPKANFFQAIATHYPHVNLSWLLIGQGEMYHTSKEDGTNALSEQGEMHKNRNDVEIQMKAKIGELVLKSDSDDKKIEVLQSEIDETLLLLNEIATYFSQVIKNDEHNKELAGIQKLMEAYFEGKK